MILLAIVFSVSDSLYRLPSIPVICNNVLKIGFNSEVAA